MDPAIPAIAGPYSFSSLPTFLCFKFGIISFNGGEFCHFFLSIDMLEGLWSSESILVLVCWAAKQNLSVDVWLWLCVCACLNVFVCVCFRMCVWGVVYLWKSSISCVFFSYLPLYYDAIKHNQLQWINISHYLLYIIEDCSCTYTSCITSLVVRSWWTALVQCGRSEAYVC